MSRISYMMCDGCGSRSSDQADDRATRWMVVGISSKSVDVCSLECALLWVARFWEDTPSDYAYKAPMLSDYEVTT